MISDLLGKTIFSIEKRKDDSELIFMCDNGTYRMYHEQDCCENVYIVDICGDMNDLIDSVIIEAEKVSNNERDEYDESTTWTFYKLRTAKGPVTIRWCGSSNGYYSEDVSFELMKGE